MGNDVRVFPKGPKYYENFDSIFRKEEVKPKVQPPTYEQLNTAICVLEAQCNHGHSEDEDCQAVANWLRDLIEGAK